ncbi:MAG: alpha/beta hydrolase [Candidatus Odyssella sp.]|nr:alpha/beta hydrolase [Candidatus Odyssella sp.]
MFAARFGLVLGTALAALSPASAQTPRPALPELKFVEIPAAAREHFAGDRFSYMEAGKADAPPVLLLHGIGANSFYWRYQYAGLSDRYRLIAWNAPGYILTDPLRKERPTCTDYADALAVFADAMGVQRFALAGNSFGSAIALCFAEKHLARVTRLALSGVSIGAKNTPPAEREAVFQRRQKQFEAAGGMKYARDVIGLLTGPATPARAKPEIMEVLSATSGRGYLQASFVPYELDVLAFAGKIAVPVLIYQGTEDKIAPIARNAEPLAKALPNVKLVRLENFGHLPDVEDPDRANALLREFLGDAK